MLAPILHTLLLLAPGLMSSPPPAAQAERPVHALKAAVRLHEEGRHADCLRKFTGLKTDALLNEDAALFVQGQCAFYAGELRQAQAAFALLLSRHPTSLHADLARAREADCLWEQDQRAAAVAIYASLQESDDAKLDKAVGLTRRALASNSVEQTEQLWHKLRVLHTSHPLALTAPPGRKEPEWNHEQVIELARALHKARRWDEALALLDSLPDPKDRPRRFRMARMSARLLFDRRGSYDRASEMLLGMRRYAPDKHAEEDAWFFGSRALGRADLDARAVASHQDMVAKFPKGRHAARALFYAGWLEQNQGHRKAAIALFDRVLEHFPDSSWARQARWFKAWSLIRLKAWKPALATLKAELAHPNWRLGGRALYWSAMAQRAEGDQAASRSMLLRLIERHPLTWYSLLARARLGQNAPELRQLPPASRPGKPLSDPLLDRARELVAADLKGLAAQALRHGEQAFRARHPGRSGRLALMGVYREAGDFNKPWRMSVILEQGALRSWPDDANRPIWEHSYPACERELLQRFTGDDEDLLLFLQAIMRTESGFDPMALSVANARGLLQMIPPTASRVAEALGLESFEQDDLFDPEINLRTAAWYIGGILKKFKRQWPLAAAAYNGGPVNMMRWCDDPDMAALELDAFVESIPFTESRKYAKAVITAWARYAIMEGRALPILSMKVHTEYLKTEPNF